MYIPNYVSAKAAIQEFIRLTGIEGEIDKSDLLAWASDAVSRIVTADTLVHKISLLTVNNYRAALPHDFRTVIQVAYKELERDKRYNKEIVSQVTEKILGSECDLEVNINCPICHEVECEHNSAIIEVDADQLWRTSNPQYAAAGMKHFYKYGGTTGRENSYYHPEFRLIKHATNSFSGLHRHIKDCLNLVLDSQVEYSLNEGVMNLNVKDGYILIAYLGDRIDEEGYRYIPNVPIVMTAISYYMAERWLYREYLRAREQKDRIAWQQHVELTERYIGRAKSELQTPEFDEWMVFVKKFWHKVIPEYSYEENLFRGNDPKYKFQYQDQSYNMRGYNR